MNTDHPTPSEGTRFLQDTHAEGTPLRAAAGLPDRVIMPDDSGEMIARPIEEVAAAMSEQDEVLELFITDEVKKDKNAWTSTVTIAGSKTKFHIRELDEDEKTALNHRNTHGLAEALGISVACVEDKGLFQQKIKEIPKGMDTWMNFQVETNLNLCLEHVKGWVHDPKAKAKPAFSPDVIRKMMSPSARFKLAQAIIEKSTIGASQSDFLEPS